MFYNILLRKLMIKKKPYGQTLREQLIASSRERLYHFLLDYGSVRGALLHATRMINEMRSNHELGLLETHALGQAYLAAGLMSVNLKGLDRLSLKIQCSGPIRGLSVEANAFGEVRGYLFQAPIPRERPLESLDLAPFFGDGVLSVTRYLQDAKQPFTGQVRLELGNLAEDLARYFLSSEQARTAFRLSLSFDVRGEVLGAGGLFLQVMPGTEEGRIAEIEEALRSLPAIGAAFSQGVEPQALLQDWFGSFCPLLLGNRRAAFMCHCGKERFRRFLGALPAAELRDILEKGPFPVVTTCFNCNSAYSFARGEIEELSRKALR